MTLFCPRLAQRRLLVFTLLVFVFGHAAAQDCQEHNFVAVNDVVLEGVRPCYFIAHGDNGNAFIQAAALADALGASLALEGERLVFEKRDRTVSVLVTSEIRSGLQVHSGALVVDGKGGDALPGIATGGEHYVAVGPVAKALGAHAEWDGAHGIIFIDLPGAMPAPSPQPDSEPPATAPPATEAVAVGSLRMEGAPRVGLNHDQGFTRVVLNLPAAVSYDVSVGQTQLLLTLNGLSAEPYAKQLDDLYLKSLQLYPVDGGMALRLEATHGVGVAGEGFKVGLLSADSSTPQPRLFVDLGPELRASEVQTSHMTDATPQERVQEMAREIAVAAVNPRVNNITVVIDPGHGGHDGGATGQSALWHEKQVVLAISLKLREILRVRGVEVIMTREGDSFLELSERAGMATNDRNVFVSIHANGADSRTASGIETFVFGVPVDDATLQQAIRENAGAEGREVGERRTEEALEVANSIAGNIFRQEQLAFSKALAEIVQRRMVDTTDWVDRGVKENAFAVLRSARTPAILVEVGFMTNPEEGRLLATEPYQRKLAEAIADGIVEFLDLGGQLSARH